jgi:hypothetical protein
MGRLTVRSRFDHGSITVRSRSCHAQITERLIKAARVFSERMFYQELRRVPTILYLLRIVRTRPECDTARVVCTFHVVVLYFGTFGNLGFHNKGEVLCWMI